MNAPSRGGVGPPSRELLHSTISASGVVAFIVACMEAQARQTRLEASGSHGDTAGMNGEVDANFGNQDPGEIMKCHMDLSPELIEHIFSSFGRNWVRHCKGSMTPRCFDGSWRARPDWSAERDCWVSRNLMSWLVCSDGDPTRCLQRLLWSLAERVLVCSGLE